MKPTRPILSAAILALALLGAAIAGVVAHASAATKTVNVTEKEFKITLSPKKVTAGSIQFKIKNTGRGTHGLAISGPGVAKKQTAMIKPGKTATLKVTLRAGRYSIWCPVPGHAAEGMKTTLTVAGAGGSTPPAATSTASTTTDGGGGGGDAWG